MSCAPISQRRSRAASISLLLTLLPATAAGADVEWADQFASAWQDPNDTAIVLTSDITVSTESLLQAPTAKTITAADAATKLIFSSDPYLTDAWACSSETDITIGSLTLEAHNRASGWQWGLLRAEQQLHVTGSMTIRLCDDTAEATTGISLLYGGTGLSFADDVTLTIDLTALSGGLAPNTSYILFETPTLFEGNVPAYTILGGSQQVTLVKEISNDPSPTTTRIILTTANLPIPEPGSSILSLLALATLILPRRRTVI